MLDGSNFMQSGWVHGHRAPSVWQTREYEVCDNGEGKVNSVINMTTTIVSQ